MTEQPTAKKSPRQAGQSQTAEEGGNTAAAGAAEDPSVTASAAGEQPTPKKLTPEEQMALYEKDLKENDWGHQPC